MSNDDRRTYIGGRGAATILGVNPYQTPVALWQYITGRADPIEINSAMRSGMRLEPAVLDYAAEMLGSQVLPGPFIRDPKDPLAGHLDGLTASHPPAIIEGKTTRSHNGYGEPGTNEVPPDVAAQCMHYLGLVPEAQFAYVTVLFPVFEFALYKIERDDALIARMREICLKWWRDYVETDMPPPPTTGADAALLFPVDSGRVVLASDGIAADVERLRAVHGEILQLEHEEDELTSRVKLAMGDAASLMAGGETVATWRTTRPTLRFNQTAFKAAHPDVYAKFCRETTSRRFLLRGIQRKRGQDDE